MEKGFREAECPGCKSRLKFPVSEKDYGKMIKVRCPRCRSIYRCMIPVPPQEKPAQKKEPSRPPSAVEQLEEIKNLMKNMPFPGGFSEPSDR